MLLTGNVCPKLCLGEMSVVQIVFQTGVFPRTHSVVRSKSETVVVFKVDSQKKFQFQAEVFCSIQSSIQIFNQSFKLIQMMDMKEQSHFWIASKTAAVLETDFHTVPKTPHAVTQDAFMFFTVPKSPTTCARRRLPPFSARQGGSAPQDESRLAAGVAVPQTGGESLTGGCALCGMSTPVME